MSYEHHFVTYLESLTQADDRGALAALRRGLGQPPGTVPDMFPYVIRHIPENASRWKEQVYYLIASVYALHPKSTIKAGLNMGDHFSLTLDPDPERNKAIERRFTSLLTAHPEDMPTYLRQAVSFLKSQKEDGIAINWHQLMGHMLQWNKPEKRVNVQKRWANQFWRLQKKDDEQDSA
ncbi:MAG: type I-E CRISPR-associated protein Cse2/CasB [Chloroflexi bacterium]|nr:type I-E CRISPR-associated protein Cse2/CasB [Chloroflexota bacterium]